jgi:hypothetical protein
MECELFGHVTGMCGVLLVCVLAGRVKSLSLSLSFFPLSFFSLFRCLAVWDGSARLVCSYV